jgi:non-ribosomal peptide synthetase component E (peptide arylation enzyme)
MVSLIFSEITQFMEDHGIASFKIPERIEIINDVPSLEGVLDVKVEESN